MTTMHSLTVSRFRPVVYDMVRDSIRNGDLALSRGSSIEGQWISDVTGSQYTHATMLGWAKPNTLMIGETRQQADGRLIDARSEFLQWPGYYDVYRPRSKRYRGDAAWTFMCHAAGSRYSYRHIAKIWARKRLGDLILPIENSDDPAKPRFCSELVHAALRAGHGPQIEQYGFFDCDVAPGDLADPIEFRYLFTVFASLEQAELVAGG